MHKSTDGGWIAAENVESVTRGETENKFHRPDLVRFVIDSDRARWAYRSAKGWRWMAKADVRCALRLHFDRSDVPLVMAATVRNPSTDTDIETWQ